MLKRVFTKIVLIIFVGVFLMSCNALKNLNEDHYLIEELILIEDEKEINFRPYRNLIRQEPNTKILGIPLKLYIYNLAKKEPDVAFDQWLYKKPNRSKRFVKVFSKKQFNKIRKTYIGSQNQLKKMGEAPAVADQRKTTETVNRLKSTYWNQGWFNAEVIAETEKNEETKRAKITYRVNRSKAYYIDSIQVDITSPQLDSLFKLHKNNSFLVQGKPYNTINFENERDRIDQLFKNNGVYYFDRSNINFEADTIRTNQKVNVKISIGERVIRSRDRDTLGIEPFKTYKISEVNIFTNYNLDTKRTSVTDSAHVGNYKLYSFGKMNYRSKIISDNVFIKPDRKFRNIDRIKTFDRFSEMRVFRYPTITYIEDPRDPKGEELIANVFLSPRERFGYNISTDISQSNIMDIGFGFNTSLMVRNVFKGAEILEISGLGIIGSSKDAASASSQFLNISEIGANARLSWPKIAFPLRTERFITNEMSPFTSLNLGFSSQQNIGLDRRNFTSSFSYRWKPRKQIFNQFDLINIQFINNLNAENYFNVFRSSFSDLNALAQNNSNQLPQELFETSPNGQLNLIIPRGADDFIQLINQNVVDLTDEENRLASSIIERRNRLSENNLILSTNFTMDYSTRRSLEDEDFYQIRGRLELAGNVLSLLADGVGLEQNNNGNYDLFGVQFSQYVKSEINFIKRFDLGRKNVIATRAYGGIAIPYGNANSIPFIRSFFAGGPNDNRGWQPYDLGPGRTGGTNDFNEANFKLAFNAEYRFNLFGSFNAAIFIDAGNIWNVFDSVLDKDARFTSFTDLSDLSIATGFGLRYDLSFFVIRMDLGFKTYEPTVDGGLWFKNYNFSNVVYNFGINYPF